MGSAKLLLLLLGAAGQLPPPPDLPGKVLILSSVDMGKNEFLLLGEELASNSDFLVRAVQAFCGARRPSSAKARPKVVVFDGRRPKPEPLRPALSEYGALVKQLEELFEVEEISLKERDTLRDVEKRLDQDRKKEDDERPPEEKPDRISCLIVAQPHDLEERQIYEISRAVSGGIPTVFLVSYHSIDISEAGLKSGFPIQSIRPEVEGLFVSWGIILDPYLLASRTCASIPLPKEVSLGKKKETIRAPRPLPALIRVEGEALNREHPLLKDVPRLVLPGAVGLTVAEEVLRRAGLKATRLLGSGQESYTVRLSPQRPEKVSRPEPPALLGIPALSDPAAQKDGFQEPRTLGILLEGKFPFAYRGQSVPPWRP